MRCALATFALVIAGSAYAQSSAKPEFEVASVKVSKLEGLIATNTPTLNVEPGRDIHFENIQLRDLIMLAYGVGIRQISAPIWMVDPRAIATKALALTSSPKCRLTRRRRRFRSCCGVFSKTASS
jgi:hypothetical protein